MKKDEYLRIINETDFEAIYREIEVKLNELRLLLKKNDAFQISSMNHFNLEYTYFYLTTEYLRLKSCRFTVIFNHQNFLLETWLVAQNKETRKQLEDCLDEKLNYELANLCAEIDDNFIDKDNESLVSKIIKSLEAFEHELKDKCEGHG